MQIAFVSAGTLVATEVVLFKQSEWVLHAVKEWNLVANTTSERIVNNLAVSQPP